ncbi:SRPBCC domain-containing protein [Ferruginibacter sp.]
MKSNITGRTTTVIDAPREEVWEALTNPDIIKQYFFGTHAISDWKKGSSLIFKGEWEGKTYEDKGTILEIDPGRLLKYNYWGSMSGIEDKPENYADITYWLTETIHGTKLTITQENIPDEKMKAHSEQNWNKVLNNLKNLLEKKAATV